MKGLSIFLAACTLAAMAGSGYADDVSAGRVIYTTGEPVSGRAVRARVAGGDALPASLLPCVNCHRHDGRGVAEGGVTPSQITWLDLTKPYLSKAANGRRRPAYDARSFERAVREGIDPAGNRLSAAMPRYEFSAAEFRGLIAYLDTLGRQATPGVTATSVRIATAVPRNNASAEIAKQIVAVLRATFADAGEIHGRRIELVVLDSPATPIEKARFELEIASEPPFAFVSGFDAGGDGLLEGFAESHEIPLVLPLVFHSDASASNRQRFYLYPGLEDQLAALIKFTEKQRNAPYSRLIVLAPEEPPWLQRVQSRLDRPMRFDLIESDRAGAYKRLTLAASAPNTGVLLLDPAFALLQPLPPHTPLLLLSALLPRSMDALRPEIWREASIAVPFLPNDISAKGLDEFTKFLDRHGILKGHMPTQMTTFAAARVLLDALASAGRELSRPGLITSLEGLYDVHTGVTPALSFGRHRRIAVGTVPIAAFDSGTRRFVRLGEWPILP